MVVIIVGSIMVVFKEIKNKNIIWLVIFFSMYLKEEKLEFFKEIYFFIFIVLLCIIGKK